MSWVTAAAAASEASGSQHLVRGQVQVTEHRSERMARIDRVQELLPHLEW